MGRQHATKSAAKMVVDYYGSIFTMERKWQAQLTPEIIRFFTCCENVHDLPKSAYAT